MLRLSALFFALLLYFMPGQALFNCPGARVVFVNNCYTSPIPPGSGTYADPYMNLTDAITGAGECGVIFVFPGDPYDALGTGFTLLRNQRLLGTANQLFQLCTNCIKPELINPDEFGAAVVTLADNNNNEVSGFTITCITTQVGIRNGVGVANFTPETIITNNDITTVAGSGIAFNASSTITGTVFINNCKIYASTPSAEPGIIIQNTNKGNVIITNNLISRTLPANGFPRGISHNAFLETSSVLMQNNTIDFLGSAGRGIFLGVDNSIPSISVNATIASNTISTTDASAATGIFADMAFLSGSLCLTLTNNTVTVPANIPGYLLWNSNNTGAFSLYEDSNVGSFMINNSVTGLPFSGTAFPVSFTNWRCPEQDAIIRFLNSLPMP